MARRILLMPPRLWLGLLLASAGCTHHVAPAGSGAAGGCLARHDGYLRARARGALDLDVDWRDRDLQCAGEPRPDQGARVAFAGPPSHGARLRFVFGIDGLRERQTGRHLPTNVTIIDEAGQRLFSTRGSGQCSIDELEQQPLPASDGLRHYRVIARGFCIGPAGSLSAGPDLLLSRFDFAGSLVFGRSD
jgi:hypothetical protein